MDRFYIIPNSAKDPELTFSNMIIDYLEEHGARCHVQKITEKNQNEREKLAADCEQVIEEKVQETMEWLLLSRVDGTIETLQKRCSQIETDSYEYLNRKIPLNHREQKLLKKVLHASLQRLIREPIQELKQLEDEEKQKEYQNILKTLFRMYEDE